jgi:hypothetical protein
MKKRLHHPSAERVRELLTFDSETGVFRVRVRRPGSHAKVGDIVGCPTVKGYLRIQIDGELWYSHLLAWLYVFNEWVDELDHRDGDSGHNAIGNLRPCDRSQNNANWKLGKRNKHGLKGVTYVARLPKPWRAQHQVKGKNRHIGCFETKEAANAAYMDAVRGYFGDFARGS